MKKNIYLIVVASICSICSFAQVPTYTIAQLTQHQNASFMPDSLGVHARITGTVYGVNVHSGGTEFMLRDATAGIEVFSAQVAFNYTVNEGDSLIVEGVVAFYDGLIELQSLDTIIRVGTGTLMQPVVVTNLDETTEAELIRINHLTVVSPAQWSGTGNGFDCQATDGTNTYTIFVYELCDLYSMPAPTGTFDLIGIGSQHCTTSPYNTGYSITPRYHQDILNATGIVSTNAPTARIYPNPSTGRLNIERNNAAPGRIMLSDMSGKVVYDVLTNASMTSLDTRDIAAGVYMLQVISENGVYRSKINIQ